MSIEMLSTWIAAGITLCIFSSLYRDNPFYRFAEHLFVGVSAGYYVSAVAFHQVLKPNFLAKLFPGAFLGGGATVASEWALIVPGILGLLMLTRLSERFSWLSKISVAFVMGVVSAMTIVTYAREYLFPQIQKAIVPLYLPGNAFGSFSNLVLLVGTVSCLFYFFFSVDQSRSWARGVSRVGVGFLMVSFGASFGATVMGRISLLIGRFQFLMQDFAGTLPGNHFGILIGVTVLVLSCGYRARYPSKNK